MYYRRNLCPRTRAATVSVAHCSWMLEPQSITQCRNSWRRCVWFCVCEKVLTMAVLLLTAVLVYSTGFNKDAEREVQDLAVPSQRTGNACDWACISYSHQLLLCGFDSTSTLQPVHALKYANIIECKNYPLD